MPIDKKTVEYVANLARIELSDKELEKLSLQLDDILDFIDKLNGINVDKVVPTSHILQTANVLRQDSVKSSLPLEKVLGNTPEKEDKFFSVPKVIE